MLKIMTKGPSSSDALQSIPVDRWIHCVDPQEEELTALFNLGIPHDMMAHVHDMDERTRVERKDGVTYMVIHFPHQQDPTDRIPFITVPLNIFVTPHNIVTVEPENLGLEAKLVNLMPDSIPQEAQTSAILEILLLTASEYLTCLDSISHSVEEAEALLVRSLRNHEVLLLLNNQKSLVYFTTALNMIEMLLHKLRKGEFLTWNEETLEGVDDVLIEVRQAMYQVEIAQDILTQMMDAFASIVSNNLNTVMKLLAAITIIVSVPTLIASLYGMNVPLPGSGNPVSFWALLSLSVILSFLVIVIFHRRDWL